MAKNYKIEGRVTWFKALGEPVPNYDGDENEWTFDLTPNERGLDLLRRVGLGEKIKNKDDDRDDFIQLKRREFKKGGENDGERNNPIPVYEEDGETEWNPDTLIGNGSLVKVKIGIVESKWKGKTFLKPIPYSVTVLNLKEFKPKDKAVPAKATRPAAGVSNAATRKKPAAKAEDWAEDNDPIE